MAFAVFIAQYLQTKKPIEGLAFLAFMENPV
jgi:hypothetical protein